MNKIKYPKEFYKIRKKILERDNYECKHCGLSVKLIEKLLVHHIDRNPLNNNPSNLITLCENCHNLAHSFKKPTHGRLWGNIEVRMSGTDYFYVFHKNCPLSDNGYSVMNLVGIIEREDINAKKFLKHTKSPVFVFKCTKCDFTDAIKPCFL
jgi:ribosomal protein S27AE